MNDRIQEIKKRLAEATLGPWEAVVGNYNEIAIVGQKGLVMSFGGYAGFDNFKGTEPSDEDERFITWAPSDISYLLSEVERLQSQNETLKEALEWVAENAEAEPALIEERVKESLSHLKG